MVSQIRPKIDKKRISFIVVLISVVLSFCLLVGSVASWLIRDYTFNDTDNAIGSVDVRIYADDVEVTGETSVVNGVPIWICNTPYVIGGSSTTRNNINLTLRNYGNIDAIVRVTMSLYYIDDYSTPAKNRPVILTTGVPSTKGVVNMTTTDWVYGFPSETVASGHMFYNKKLSPYVSRTPNETNTDINETIVAENEIKLIDSIVTSSAQASTTFYVSLTVEAVAYAGNIYKKMENGETSSADIPVSALPFGPKANLPTAWTAWL